jgi:pimeloyl-ACP methyl ester carboxylesterase
MLLLHGISSSLDYFGPSISLLACPFRVIVFRECGHSPMLEYPERFSSVITEFVFQEPPLV